MEFDQSGPDVQPISNHFNSLKRFYQVLGLFLATAPVLGCSPAAKAYERSIKFVEVCNPDRINKIDADPYIMVHLTLAERMLHDESFNVLLTRSNGFSEERAKFDPKVSLENTAAVILESDIQPGQTLVLEVKKNDQSVVARYPIENINPATGGPCLFPKKTLN